MNPAQRTVVASYLVSGVLHAALVGSLMVLIFPEWDSFRPTVDTAIASRPVAETEEVPIATPEPVDESSSPYGMATDALAEVSPSDTGLAGFAKRKLEQERLRNATRSTAGQLQDLDALARQLDAVSSSQSLSQLTDTIGPWIGSDASRATEPTDGDGILPGRFDPSTAQISNVLKREQDASAEYVALMIDAEGRSQYVPLDRADGETLYEVFRLMERFPLLETVYRKTVMGLLDRLMEEQAAGVDASQAAQPGSEEDEQQQEE